jgi:hypothetical protein
MGQFSPAVERAPARAQTREVIEPLPVAAVESIPVMGTVSKSVEAVHQTAPPEESIGRHQTPEPAIVGSVNLDDLQRSGHIDKSRLMLGTERRLRDKEHLRRVAELPCLVCNRQPSQAHHLRFAQRRGLGQKVSDEFVVPLCALHHSHLHRSMSEVIWWERQKIEPVSVSRELWLRHRSA